MQDNTADITGITDITDVTEARRSNFQLLQSGLLPNKALFALWAKQDPFQETFGFFLALENGK